MHNTNVAAARFSSELARTKKVSPKELTAACLARIQRLNPTLNACITVTADQATADAQRVGRGGRPPLGSRL
jgi:Asp-tRNA(Asn)/Glu-tRNA(Gln) amidotransferase A subunit family amidase